LEPYGAPLYVSRGFPSATYMFEAAEALKRIDKPKYIYYLGDHDASGISIEETIRRRLDEFGVSIDGFERIAITLDDIQTYNLQPLPVKTSDKRHKGYTEKYGTQTIELDALPPNVLRERIVEAVERHIQRDEWERLLKEEEIEQETIRNIAKRMGGAA